MKNKFLIFSNFATITLVMVLLVQLKKTPTEQSIPDASEGTRNSSLEKSILENQYNSSSHINSINDRLSNLELKLDFLVTNIQAQQTNSENRERNPEFVENKPTRKTALDTEKYVAAETLTNDILASGVLSVQRSMELSIALQDLGASAQGYELTKKINAAINRDEIIVEDGAFP